MKFNVPYNWDEELIDRLAALPGAETIDHLYGQAGSDFIGGGRPSVFLSAIDSESAGRHIKKARSAGFGFNYLLNSSCFEIRPFDSLFLKKLRLHLDFLCGCGITAVTLSDPAMIKLVKKYYPHLKISVSIFAMLKSVSEVKYYEQLGVSDILIANPNDFKFIAAVRSAVSCNIVLFANLGCLIFCPECSLHSYAMSHSSQSEHMSGRFYIEHHVLRCSMSKINDPESLLKTMYVRPEDASLYETFGVDKLKIIDRTAPSDTIVALTKSYLTGIYDGNFLDIIHDALSLVNKTHRKAPNLKLLLSPSKINLLKLIFNVLKLRPFKINIDNRALDGMKRAIMESGVECSLNNCRRCGICRKYFMKAAFYSESERMESIKTVKEFLNSVSSSSIFGF